MTDAERIAKRVARDLRCSRADAERYVECGFVTVDGVVVDTPPTRVSPAQRVELVRGATARSLAPVTLLLHKPPDVDGTDGNSPAATLLAPQSRAADDRSGIDPLSAHLKRQRFLTPLDARAAGLVVWSQDPRVVKRLLEDARLVEHEMLVDVAGTVDADLVARLERPASDDTRPQGAMRVSVGSTTPTTTRLRFAVKGYRPGRIDAACAEAGLQVVALRRTRIGRVPLGTLEAGQWRYLGAAERF